MDSYGKAIEKVSCQPLVGLGGGSWDALGAAEFGFDVRDIALGEVIEELPGAVFLPDLRQNGLAEAGAALALLLGRTDPFTQVGKIAAESGDIGGRAGVAVARDEGDGRFGGKLGECGESFEPGKRRGVNQIGKSLPPEQIAAEQDGGFLLLNDDDRIAASVARIKLHADGWRADAELER